MQVTVGNQLRIENPSEQLLAWCKKQLILPNPEYAKKVRMHFWVGNTPEKLYLFQWDGDTLVLPYGCLNDVLAMDDCHMKVNLPTPTEVDFGCTMVQIQARKVPSIVHVDDRAICFDGRANNLYEQIVNFKPWYERESENENH